MVRRVQIFYYVFIHLSLLASISSQLIATSSPFTPLNEQYQKEMNSFFQNKFNDTLKDTNYSEVISFANSSYVEIKEFTYLDYTFNSTELAVSISDDDNLKGGNNVLTLKFSFRFSIDSKLLKAAELILSNFTFFGSMDWDRSVNIPKIKISIDDTFAVYQCTKIASSDEPIITQTLAKSFRANIDRIKEYLEKGVSNYYVDLYKQNKPIGFTTSQILKSIPIEVKMDTFSGFCKDVTKKRELGVCYYSGNIGTTLYNNINDALALDQFSKDPEWSKVFLHKEILNQIFPKVLKDPFTFELNSENKPKKADYQLTVHYIGYIFPDLLSTYKKESPIFISNEIQLIKVEENGVGVFEMVSSISVKEEATIEVVKFRSVFNFAIQGKINNGVLINVCLASVVVKSIKIETAIKVTNLALLGQWAQSTFNNFNQDNLICISEEYINLNNFFKSIEMSVAYKNGLYFIGKGLYNINK